MPQLRVGLVQADLCVGDLVGNVDQVLRWARHARSNGAHLIAFPEMALTGYPAEDLVLRSSFVDASRAALDEVTKRLFAEGLGDLAVVVGYLDRDVAGRPQNCAAFVHQGRVVARYAKHHLPNYGVFDEFRYFTPGTRLPIVRLHGVDIATVICEDLWQDGGPIVAIGRARTGLTLVINGSPYERGKFGTRLDLARRRAGQAQTALAYVNLVGGQDELVFDGGSFVIDSAGNLLAQAPVFEAGLVLADLELPMASSDDFGTLDVEDGTRMVVERVTISSEPPQPYVPQPSHLASPLSDEAEVYAALVAATRDYVRKNGFRSVILGLSGGIDSALVATIAVDALGAAAVHGVAMPSRYSSEHSLADAQDLASRQQLTYSVVPINSMVEAFEGALPLDGLAAENLQARLRGMTLMALSNTHGHLVLTTGNKSELAVGYSTLYGDTAGGFAPIKDVPKTLVWALARWRNRVASDRGQIPPIPENSITKPPSAELRPDQLDADSLPDYDVLDKLLEDYVGADLGRDALVAAGHDPVVVDRVLRLVDAAEYKRRQYPPGPKISARNFGRDRRLPITSRWGKPVNSDVAPEVEGAPNTDVPQGTDSTPGTDDAPPADAPASTDSQAGASAPVVTTEE